MRLQTVFAAIALPLLAAGCSSSGGGSRDHGAPSTVYPAPHTALPQLKDNGGAIQDAPVFHAITWNGDSLQATVDDFVTKTAASTYWAATTSEYGVGAATLGSAGHIATAAPGTISEADIDNLVLQLTNGSVPALANPTGNDQYLLFFPDTTVISDNGANCNAYLGYHSYVTVGATDVAYAVIPRCPAYGGMSILEVLTGTASHEMVETATDPGSTYAWADTDAKNGAWDWWSGGGENGDMCQDLADANTTPADLGYAVQRSWSNAAAAASHDPCQPTTAVYFGAAPVLPDTAQINLGGGFNVGSAAVRIGVGGSRTIELDVFSDAATGPITVHAADAAQLYGNPAELSFSLDRASAVNGEKLYLTVHVDRAGTFYGPGGHFFLIVSEQGGSQHYWVVFVSNG